MPSTPSRRVGGVRRGLEAFDITSVVRPVAPCVPDGAVDNHRALAPHAHLDARVDAASVEVEGGLPDPLDILVAETTRVGAVLGAGRGDLVQVLGNVDPPQEVRDQREPWNRGHGIETLACASVPTPDAYVHELRVRYGECDPQGIVFNANYLLYFDVAFTELWRAAVGPWQEMVERGFDAVVAEANARFRLPARFDDVIGLHARVANLGETSITTEIEVRRGEELLVEGWLRHVVVSTDDYTKTAMPDWVRAGLERYSPTS